jgi:hypothetical protein
MLVNAIKAKTCTSEIMINLTRHKYIPERSNDGYVLCLLMILGLCAKAKNARWRSYLKGKRARKVPFNTTLALDTMDLDHLRTVEARGCMQITP